MTIVIGMHSLNLSLDNCGGTTVKTDTGPAERYGSLKECSQKRNIAFSVLSKAKQSQPLPHHGFRTDGRIEWENLQPWLSVEYTKFLPTVTDEDNEEREKLELRKLKAEVVKLENYNKSKSIDWISRKSVLSATRNIYGNLFSKLSRYLEHELPTKVEGMNSNQIKAVTKEYLQRLFSEIKQQEQVWAKAEDVGGDDENN